MRAEQNQRITQVGSQTPCGKLLRHYWQPVALLDEFDETLVPEIALRPVKAVTVLGQALVLFRDAQGRFSLMDRDCPHRGADLAFGRVEPDGLRCLFHGWKFGIDGQCTDTPGEPKGSQLCTRIKQRTYPLVEKSGIVFAYLGNLQQGEAPPAFAALDCFEAPASHTFAFKGYLECNWLQALEVGIDPAHASFLHRYFEDDDVSQSYGKQFRGASAGSQMPMTQLLREYQSPDIHIEATAYGMRLSALRHMDNGASHVRVTNQIFPQAFVIPLSADISITQWHVPIDDTHCYWFAIFTGFTAPLDKAQMREQRLQLYTLPDYKPRVNKTNQYGFNAQEQLHQTYTGMGSDINVHDQWAVESPGPIQDRTREHLGTTDKGIIAYRRQLLKAIDATEAGDTPPMVLTPSSAAAIRGPATIDGICLSGDWQAYWREVDRQKRLHAPWHCAALDSE